MDLSELTTHVAGLFATDAKLALLPVLSQVLTTDATDESAQEAADDYKRRFEAALAETGVVAVVIAAGGDLASDKEAPVLDLWNSVVVAIQANAKTNRTGLTAWGHTRRAMRVIHCANTREYGARVETKLAKRAYDFGPFGGGMTVYFVNALVRTTEELGAIEPVST